MPKDFFDGLDQGNALEGFEASDARTLRLAAPLVTSERLDGLVRYLRVWLDAVKRLGPDGLAQAQREALDGAVMSPRELGTLEAIVRDFCGKRWSVRALERRHGELKALRDQGALGPGDAGKLARLESELHRLDVLPALERRYGHEAIALLCAREDELLELHQAIGQAVH